MTFWRDGADATTAAIMVGDMLGGLAEDPDGNVGDTPPITDMYPNITGATWQWAKSMTPDMMDSWMDITGATDAAYTVMDADEGYHLRATAMYDDGEGMGKMASEKTMMVGADDAGGTLLDRYDANDDESIDRDEMVDALRDYIFNDAITRDDMVNALAALHLWVIQGACRIVLVRDGRFRLFSSRPYGGRLHETERINGTFQRNQGRETKLCSE